MSLTGKPSPNARGVTPNSGPGAGVMPTGNSSKPAAQYAAAAEVTNDKIGPAAAPPAKPGPTTVPQ